MLQQLLLDELTSLERLIERVCARILEVLPSPFVEAIARLTTIPGINERAIYVIDKTGKIVFAQLYELGEAPDNQDVWEVLEKLAPKAAWPIAK